MVLLEVFVSVEENGRWFDGGDAVVVVVGVLPTECSPLMMEYLSECVLHGEAPLLPPLWRG